jgi:hypothetical protein
VAEDAFDRAQLIGLGVNDEIALVAQALDVLAQNPHAQRMKGADGRARRLFAVLGFCDAPQKLADALLHFARRLVGEGHRQDMPRPDALLDRRATRKVMTRVLPVPAPAKIKTGPSVVSTAWRCAGFKRPVQPSNARSAIFLPKATPSMSSSRAPPWWSALMPR